MQTKNLQGNSSPTIMVLPDRSSLAREAAMRFVAIARESVQARRRFAVVLSGGSTPRELYALLATSEFSSQVDWSRAYFFWGDERAVSPDHPDSNYRMANEALLSRVLVPAENIHRIRTELPAEDAAREYEKTIQDFFGRGLTQMNADKKIDLRSTAWLWRTSPQSIRVPIFDLVLLGLGANGHTASLFPHTRVLHDTLRWVAAEYIEQVKMWRITFTAPIINAAENILWLVAGADKATTVREVLRGAYRPDDLPAQLIQPAHGQAVWLLDKDAASF